MNKKLSILLAVIMLFAAQLACALGEPTLSNVRTSSDQEGNSLTSTFGAFDTVYVVGDLANAVEGNTVTSRWYAQDVPGVDPNFFIDESTITVGADPIDYVYFYFEPPADGWPAGTYKVEVFFNNAPNATVTFTVQ
ncbi:MAG: hypothetical protein HXY38_00980 [Chloroflexi bacterium]|nr:hypothetical protein [Chloroflexota bacterium]